MDYTRTVACIDTSGSTHGNDTYYDKVNELINDAFKVITWSTNAKEVGVNVLKSYDAGGFTNPHTFLEILQGYDFKYNLIVTTDGQMYDEGILLCETLLKESNILDNILDFKIYYIGRENEMNMKIDNLFTSPKFKKEIFINDRISCCVDINLDFNSITFSDIVERNDFKATLISLISRYPQEKLELRSKVCKLSNRILSELADENESVKEYFERNDVVGCINFIKSTATSDKKHLQQKMSEILNLFDSGADIYKLSHLSNTTTLQPVDIPMDSEVEKEEEDVGNDDIFCDIMYIKCKHVCLMMRNANEVIIPDEISKQISTHPFLLLKHEDIMKKILDLVEFQQIDLRTYCQLDNKGISPFTRLPLKGVYVFNGDNDDIDFRIIKKNNNRVLSVIFGPDNKLPGNKGIWNILFLYLLMKHHPKWKTEAELIKKEIQYVAANTISFLTLSPLLDPNIKDPLNICLWYVVNVSHQLSPNSSKNILREMGESSEYFLDFYSEVFSTVDEELRNKNKSWLVWNYMVQQKSNKKKFRGEVLAQYQNYIEINGTLIFFSGECEKSYQSYLNKLPVEKVLGLNSILNKNSRKFDIIDQVENVVPNITFIDDDESDDAEHVLICPETCQPTVICPVTKKHWKECARNYSVENSSYFRAFKQYCLKEMKYPKSEYDLIAYHSNKHFNRRSEFLIYPSYALKDLKVVLKKFEKIIEIYSVEEYLSRSSENNAETIRLDNEKKCSNQSCKHLFL